MAAAVAADDGACRWQRGRGGGQAALRRGWRARRIYGSCRQASHCASTRNRLRALSTSGLTPYVARVTSLPLPNPPAATIEPGTLADWRDLIALTKPRVMTLVVYTGLCGLLAAPVALPPVLAFTAVLCIALGAGAAGALNQWYEVDIDSVMKRTAQRPLPAGRIDKQTALHFGVGMSVFSVVLMGLATNVLAAAILAVSILFYVLVYTIWLKRRTAQNIVIGGAAGAFPPLLGWAAASGDVTLLPILLFAIVFLWTPPHFWALSLFVRLDYAAAGVPMLPVVAGVTSTRRHIALYTPCR